MEASALKRTVITLSTDAKPTNVVLVRVSLVMTPEVWVENIKLSHFELKLFQTYMAA